MYVCRRKHIFRLNGKLGHRNVRGCFQRERTTLNTLFSNATTMLKTMICTCHPLPPQTLATNKRNKSEHLIGTAVKNYCSLLLLCDRTNGKNVLVLCPLFGVCRRSAQCTHELCAKTIDKVRVDSPSVRMCVSVPE